MMYSPHSPKTIIKDALFLSISQPIKQARKNFSSETQLLHGICITTFLL